MSRQDIRPVTTYETILGQVLRRAREECRLSQGEMARLAGVSQPYWSKIEQGHANASIGVLRRASEQLGIRYSEIVARAEDACNEARSRGVEVLTLEDTRSADWLPLLGAAAVGALIGYIIAQGGKR